MKSKKFKKIKIKSTMQVLMYMYSVYYIPLISRNGSKF